MTKKSEGAPLRYAEKAHIETVFILIDHYEARRRYQRLFWLAAGVGFVLGLILARLLLVMSGIV